MQSQVSRENFVKEYHVEGFAKLNKINSKIIDEINSELKDQSLNAGLNNQINFKITPKIFGIVKKLINNDLDKYLKLLEKYYNQKINLAYLTISRNYETSKEYNNNSYFVSKKWSLIVISITQMAMYLICLKFL